jgi:2,4'-dihydroxyacetophenone dioxygenase
VVPHAIPINDRVWVPQGENVWFRPLCLNRSQGYWMNLLKVRKSGVLSRHRHPQAVHGLVLKGRWHYLEHDWVAEEALTYSSRQVRLTLSSSPTMSRR